MSTPPITATLDTCGMLCPLPVLKARKRLMALAPGELLELHATDPAAQIDVPHFCAEQGHILLEARTDTTTNIQIYLIQKQPQATL